MAVDNSQEMGGGGGGGGLLILPSTFLLHSAQCSHRNLQTIYTFEMNLLAFEYTCIIGSFSPKTLWGLQPPPSLYRHEYAIFCAFVHSWPIWIVI